MYMGDRLEAIPIANPPAIRQGTKTENEEANAVPREETAKISPAAMSKGLRPNRSLSHP
jgi:hypothetical protein